MFALKLSIESGWVIISTWFFKTKNGVGGWGVVTKNNMRVVKYFFAHCCVIPNEFSSKFSELLLATFN